MTGDEELAAELRLRTAIEMSLNSEIYTARGDFDQLMDHSPSFEESVVAACTDGAYSSIWAVMALSTVIGVPIQTVYPAMNGARDKTPDALTKLFHTEENRHRDAFIILWTRLGPWKPPTWTANHFVPVLKATTPPKPHNYVHPHATSMPKERPQPSMPEERPKSDHAETEMKEPSKEIFRPSTISTPLTESKRNGTMFLTDKMGNEIKITEIKNASVLASELEEESLLIRKQNYEEHVQSDVTEMEVDDVSVQGDSSVNNEISHILSEYSSNKEKNDPETNNENECTDSDSSEEPDEAGNSFVTHFLPVPDNTYVLPSGRFHSTEEAYKLIMSKPYIHADVPPGDKSDRFMLVDNSRNLPRIQSKKKCDFFDDCGIWEFSKGNTVKAHYLIGNDFLTYVERKDGKYCIRRRRKGSAASWEPLDPQPEEECVLIVSRYYATLKRDPNFKKRVSYFTNAADTSLAKLALFEYQGKQPTETESHGNAQANTGFIRTNPKTLDKIKEKVDCKKPKEIYAEMKRDDSINCARDFRVVRNQKYIEKKKAKSNSSNRENIADEILDVISMVNIHPYVQTIIHNKDQVPSVICYTEEQIKDLKHFLKHTKNNPIGIDRTFNLGSFYVTILVYKNQRIFRKNSSDHPIFLGPVLLHKDATYKTYKTFLEHIATELDSDVESLEVRVSEQMEFGTDDERALTKAIEHVFPAATRYLCTKHLKDNVKHYLLNKVGIEKRERELVMNSLFGDGGIVDANCTVDFNSRTTDFEDMLKNKYPAFEQYYTQNLKPRLQKYVFEPTRKENANKNWTNNNAESINNILKISVDWRPKHTEELILKLYSVTELHFMDYRSALHDSGNYELVPEEKSYHVPDAVWRCKSEEEKKSIFASFLSDSKRKQKAKYVTAKDGKFSVVNTAKGTARKPGQRKRPCNERTKKR